MRSFWFGGTSDDPTGTAAVYFGGPDYGVHVSIAEIDALPSVGVDVQDVPYGYGAAAWGSSHPARTIQLSCFVPAASWEATKDKIDAIALVLQVDRLAALRLDDWSDRYWLVRFAGKSGVRVAQGGAIFDLTFVAPDPRAYSTTETTQTVSLTTGTNSFNVPDSGVVPGSAEPDVEWIVKPTGSGSSSPLTLNNLTRDESLQWGNTLTAAQWLRVTSSGRSEKCETTSDSGVSYSTVNSSIVSGSRFPRLDVGAQNECELSGVNTTGTLLIRYRGRYA